jgi:hypothetical protein
MTWSEISSSLDKELSRRFSYPHRLKLSGLRLGVDYLLLGRCSLSSRMEAVTDMHGQGRGPRAVVRLKSMKVCLECKPMPKLK